MALEVTESLLRAIATKEKAISDGRTLARKGAYKSTKRTEDGTLLWAECQGSALYKLSIDLGGGTPILRCTCPVKPPPCKHTLGLLALFMEKAPSFKVGEPPAELLEKREKAVERAEKRAEAATKPRETNKAAATKKTAQQREALETLEKLVLDVAGSGLGTVDAKRASRLEAQAKQMTDAYLPGAAVALRRLAALAVAAGPRGPVEDGLDEEYDLRGEPGVSLPHEDRHRLMLRHLVRLWAIVRKGEKYLDEKLEEGEQASDADAVIEELLGRAWQLVELKEKGYWKQGLELLELAYERYEDGVREERIEQSFLVDLADGTVFVDRSYRPFTALTRTKEKESYEQVLTLSDAAVYPGFVNRRVRWELAAMKQRDPAATDWKRLHEAATPTIEKAFARFKEQTKNMLAPDDAVFLVRAKDIARAPLPTSPRSAGGGGGEEGALLIDEGGNRLLLADSPLARARTTHNLVLAAGSTEKSPQRSVLVRLWRGLQDNLVRGQPLALVAGEQRIRLGL